MRISVNRVKNNDGKFLGRWQQTEICKQEIKATIFMEMITGLWVNADVCKKTILRMKLRLRMDKHLCLYVYVSCKFVRIRSAYARTCVS